MRTPFQVLKQTGAPDAVLAFLAALVLIIGLTPWLDITLGGVTVKTVVPWYVSLFAGALFLLLFIPCIPSKASRSSADQELIHRLHWIRENILVEPLTVGSAWEARHALDGGGGDFRAAKANYRDTHIEPILRESLTFCRLLEHVTQLRRLLNELPRNGHDDAIQPRLDAELKELARALPLP